MTKMVENTLIFLWLGGPLVLGHSHPILKKVLKDCAKKGVIFGTPTTYETDLVKIITEIFSSIEQVRLQTSGTEAVGLALRLARGYSSKNYIVTVHGSYHGHQNDVLLTTQGEDTTVSNSLGIPADVQKYNLRVHYNDFDALKTLIESRKDIAAVLVEPVPGNMGLIVPMKEYLLQVRDLCQKNGVLLIFDEVISGARVHIGGAQALYDVKPDITILGKAIAGGLPIGLVGGRKEIMSLIKVGGVYAAGTYAGNPLSVKSAIATLTYLREGSSFTTMTELGTYMCSKVNSYATGKKYPVVMQSLGSVFGIYFGTNQTPASWKDIVKLDVEVFSKYHQFMISKGIYLSPSAEDVGFLSTVHNKKDIDVFIESTKDFLDQHYTPID